MNPIKNIIILLLTISFTGCITQFVPETDEDKDILVVEGMITDQPETYTVKLSKSMPLGKKAALKPLKGCSVSVSDDKGNYYQFRESSTAGTYLSDKSVFSGVVGRKYTLHIFTGNATPSHYSYQSLPMELISTPPIDSLYYEKVVIKEKDENSGPKEGCQIYLNTHDESGKCKYYRWDYTETWEFRLPYMVTNHICWITNNSTVIKIKNTSVLSENVIRKYPLNFISSETDRLSQKYSLLVNQYSLNEDEFNYWEKLQNVSQDVGGLYDVIPASIPGNIFCVEDPAERVLGYFSVSGKSSERIFIKETFRGLINLYRQCPVDTIYGNKPIPNLNSSVWVIVDEPYSMPPYKIITDKKYCADCTTRGVTIKPDFWDEEK
ncbi:MAG: DUF4249 domain-containing protein [Bacteroidales bacterium]|nr:DUF4249 domain-containing protein [Bacteroidales bacterium]